MDFPASPAVNQLFSFAGKTWKCVAVGPPAQWEIVCEGGGGIVQYQDEGVNLGSAGTVDTVDFTGAGITASRAGNKVTVNVPPAASLLTGSLWQAFCNSFGSLINHGLSLSPQGIQSVPALTSSWGGSIPVIRQSTTGIDTSYGWWSGLGAFVRFSAAKPVYMGSLIRAVNSSGYVGGGFFNGLFGGLGVTDNNYLQFSNVFHLGFGYVRNDTTWSIIGRPAGAFPVPTLKQSTGILVSSASLLIKTLIKVDLSVPIANVQVDILNETTGAPSSSFSVNVPAGNLPLAGETFNFTASGRTNFGSGPAADISVDFSRAFVYIPETAFVLL